MTFVRWFSKPRLSYLDCLGFGSCAGLIPVMGWWVLPIGIAFAFVSVAVERSTGWR